MGTGQDLESPDAIFYGDIPMSMQYQHLENHDVAALDVLIHSSADERDSRQGHFRRRGQPGGAGCAAQERGEPWCG